MSDLRLAATQALEAWFRPNGINYVDFKPYMEALRAALAEPEQKPIAYFDPQEKGFYWAKPTRVNAPMTVTIEPMPLYAAPTPRKEKNNES